MEKIAKGPEDSGRRLTNVTDYKEKKAAHGLSVLNVDPIVFERFNLRTGKAIN
jgi:hypothetical protein